MDSEINRIGLNASTPIGSVKPTQRRNEEDASTGEEFQRELEGKDAESPDKEAKDAKPSAEVAPIAPPDDDEVGTRVNVTG